MQNNRWVLGLVCLVVACAAPAQNYPQIAVTVADGVATVSPPSYQFAKGQAAVTVAVGTRGYTITGIQFSSGSGLFNCAPAAAGTWSCTVGQRDPGGRATYTVSLSGSGTVIESQPGIFIQED